jgi:hypothetical protein
MNTPDGGPAFPFPFPGAEDTPVVRGMSLRDYFAAHAPKDRWLHYQPVMATPKPEPDWTGIPTGQRAEVDPINWAARSEWDAEYNRQYAEQWPYFYADAMLKARAQS